MINLVKSIIILTIFCVGLQANAQRADEGYTQEFTYGVKKSTNGGLISGVIAKWGKAVNPTLYRTLGIELVNVKHPKERRINTGTGGAFISGKSHYLYSVRTQYGFDKILFRKAAQQGVQINALTAIGPTIGLVVPYYIRVRSGSGSVTIPFDPNDQAVVIEGSGLIFEGLGEAKIQPGLNFKGGLSFEFGTFKNSISGFEIGFMVEAFPNKIVLIPGPEIKNRSVFTSVYISLIYGNRK